MEPEVANLIHQVCLRLWLEHGDEDEQLDHTFEAHIPSVTYYVGELDRIDELHGVDAQQLADAILFVGWIDPESWKHPHPQRVIAYLREHYAEHLS